MADEQNRVVVAEHIKLEKRNEAGELYEVVEVEADASGVRAKVVHRKPGLASAEEYAQSVQPVKE